MGDMYVGKMSQQCQNNDMIAHTHHVFFMIIMFGASHKGLSRCRIGLGQNDIPPLFAFLVIPQRLHSIHLLALLIPILPLQLNSPKFQPPPMLHCMLPPPIGFIQPCPPIQFA
jgi:hypothetical protein